MLKTILSLRRCCVALLALFPSPFAQAQTYVATGQTFGYGTGSGNGQLNVPFQVAVDSGGNVYIADANNDRISKFTSAGVWARNFGAGTGSGTGQLYNPCGVALDSAGNVYVGDRLNNRIVEFSGAGVFIKNIGIYGGGNGQLSNPVGVAISGSNLYVADQNNNRIVEFDTATGNFIPQYRFLRSQYRADMGSAQRHA